MTAIWAHGQVHADIGYFYPPDELKYHERSNRGVVSINFLGTSLANTGGAFADGLTFCCGYFFFSTIFHRIRRNHHCRRQ